MAALKRLVVAATLAALALPLSADGRGSGAGGSDAREKRRYAFTQTVGTESEVAIVFSTYRWSSCIAARVQHAVATRPAKYDVVVMFDDSHAPLGHRQRVERFVEQQERAYIVRFTGAGGNRSLERAGYPVGEVFRFSPFHSGFSKVAWVVWGARQRYRHIWYLEDDVLLPCAWFNFVRTFRRIDQSLVLPGAPARHAAAGPAGATGREGSSARRNFLASRESLLAMNCSRHAWQPWVRKCNFCGAPTERRPKCLLALMRASRGLLRATDAALRAGSAGHHELMLPHVCEAMGNCTVADMTLAPGFQGVISAPNELDRAMEARLASVMRAAHMLGWRAQGEQAGCGRPVADANASSSARVWNMVFHPAKCEYDVSGEIPSGGAALNKR